MPLFEGHRDKGIERLFIEIPEDHKGSIAYKWPDQQIMKFSVVNVDLDYVAVFTNLGKVIGTLPPGRHSLGEGASIVWSWLVDRLTADAYYDTEIYFVTTRDLPNQRFGGPVDNLTDGPTGLVVTVRVFGELAFRVSDPVALLARLIGTGMVDTADKAVADWVDDQVLAAIRVVLPDLVAGHGVLAMGQIQEATAAAALAKANAALASYGVQVTAFAELNVNVADDDAAQLKQLAAAKAYAAAAGDFTTGVRSAALLEMAHGVEAGNVGAQPAVIAAGLLGTGVGAFAPPAGPPAAAAAAPPAAASPGAAAPAATVSAPAPGVATATAARFCSSCGTALPAGARFCANCGTATGA